MSSLFLESLLSLGLLSLPVNIHWVAIHIDKKVDISFLELELLFEGIHILVTDDVNLVTFLVNIEESKLLRQGIESLFSLDYDLSKIKFNQRPDKSPVLLFEDEV